MARNRTWVAPPCSASGARPRARPAPVLAAIGVAAVMAACAGARPPRSVVPGAPLVLRVAIEGADRVSASTIKARLATREPGRWPGAEAMPFDPVAWREDLRRIVRVYEAEGFYGTEVVDAQVAHRGDGVHLRVTVREGEPVRIRQLRVAGLDALPEAARRAATRAIQLRQGERFREVDWTATRGGLERALREHGFAEAKAGGEARVLVDERAADVRLEVEPGRRYRLGAILLAAERGAKIPPAAILAQARGALPEGGWYSQSALSAAQERIFEMGLFTAVSVTAAAPEEGSDLLPVVVEVREAPLRTGRAGGGIGVVPGRSEARALAEWTDRNFGGGLRSLQTRARAGWAFVPTPWEAIEGGEPDRRQGLLAELSAELAQPDLLRRPDLQGFAAARAEQDLREAYRFRSGRLDLGVAWRFARFVALQVSWSLDAYSLHDTPLGGRGAPEPEYGCAAPCLLSYAEQAISVGRRRTYPERPQGGDLQLRAREGGGVLGGVADWWQLDLDLRGYVPLSDRLVLAARFSTGSLFQRGARPLPVVLRYFGGGAGMRGFGPRRLAPLLLLPGRSPGSAVAIPTGGRALLEASVELRLTIGRRLGVAAFVDTGAATAEELDPARLTRALRLAPGAGLRYRTPLGPIRLDVAFLLPFGPELPSHAPAGSGLASPARGGCLDGGGATNACAIQLSVGEAF